MMEGKLQIAGVGHSCLDRLCTIESYPREDDSTHITSIAVQGGGAVATALVAASRLGASTAWIGNAGTDIISSEILRLLEADGVSTAYAARRPDAAGLESFVMVNPQNGSRTKFPERDVNPPIEWTEELSAALKSADILHLDGTNWANAFNAASIARDAGVVVSLDGCSMQADNERNRKLASMADILISDLDMSECGLSVWDQDKSSCHMLFHPPHTMTLTIANGRNRTPCPFLAMQSRTNQSASSGW